MTQADDATEDRRRWTPQRVAAASVIAVFLVGWVWLMSAQLGLPVPFAPGDNPDRLEDRRFAQAADDRCAAALEVIDAIPSAREAGSNDERADQVETGTVEIETMVTDLRSLAGEVETTGERQILVKWFADWDQYVADRWAHVEKLRTADADASGRDLAFVVSAIVGTGIYTERLDGFARVNDMDNCLIPGDV